MLIRFEVENFASINEKQTLNMEPAAYSDKKETNSFLWKNEYEELRLLNTTAIYGPNASGKSNFLFALTTMRKIIGRSAQSQAGDKLTYKPFKLSSKSEHSPTEFEVEFIKDNVRYLYGFTYNAERILSEWLFAYPKKKAQKWFLRIWDGEGYQWDLGRSLTGEKQTWLNSTSENTLFLSRAVQLNSVQLKPVFDWFVGEVAIAGVDGWSNRFTAKKCDDEEEKLKIIAFMKDVDIQVDDIVIEKEEIAIDKLPDELPSAIKSKILEKLSGEVVLETKFLRKRDDGSPVIFELKEESDGTQRFYSFAGPWLDALKNGRVLFVDELNSNLHPLLVKHMVDLFHCKKSNPNNAQLVFTTHETSILNQSVFRRDQIWFMQKNNMSESELYSLADFKVRKDCDNLEEKYLSGSFGATPFISWSDC
ncbi:ATP-binding protein [Photobacterium leiognathi subsp. mandapamensis]|uniref:AAA family ATPase n=1 Tax=Photobacterium leiognathi TaxID=553611 RepID=UPI000D17566F|nr:ATP-binding protein [Photobacterium leiognathi]PSU97834.1 ATP-binding protein [Photobacterium leiognathi subsp. mandapamensis]